MACGSQHVVSVSEVQYPVYRSRWSMSVFEMIWSIVCLCQGRKGDMRGNVAYVMSAPRVEDILCELYDFLARNCRGCDF